MSERFKFEDNLEGSMIKNPEYECPECGNHRQGCIDVTILPYQGKYCLMCYSKWISENIPMVKEIR